MDKRIKWLIGTLAAAFFLAFLIWFWSLGAVASEDVPQIRLEVTKASVEIKRLGAADWTKVETAIEVKPGDAIRTDVDGEAEIRWGDNGVTRLDPATTLDIDEAPTDPSTVTHSIIKLRLETGRVWSRVLKLFGPEAAFEVRTDNVVSTVRGTAFGIGMVGTSTEVMVNEGVVESMPTVGGNGVFVRQGRIGGFGGDGSLSYLRDLGPADTWAEANRKLDEIFDQALVQEVVIRFQKMQKPAPEWLVELSEDLHLGLAGDRARPFVGFYAMRRTAALVLGRNVSLQKIEDAAGMTSGKSRESVLATIRLAIKAARDPDVNKRFGDPGMHKSDVLENLRLWILSDGKAGELDAKLIGLGEGMFKAWADGDQENEKFLSDQTIKVREDLATSGDMKDAVRYALDRDALALLDAGAVVLPVVTTSTPESVGVQEEQVASSSAQIKPVIKPTVSVIPIVPGTTKPPEVIVQPQQPVACGYISTAIVARPERGAKVGEAITLALSGTCPDGTVDDLTARARFNPGLPSDGKIDGRIFYPAKDGTITLYGTVDVNGKTLVAKTLVSVEKPTRRLVGVKVSALGPTTITTGQSVALQAMAAYSDDSTSDVTYQCGWLTSDERMATVTNQRLQSLAGTGEVSVTCNYAEGGTAVFGSLMITIVLDPLLQPNVAKPIQQYPGNYILN